MATALNPGMQVPRDFSTCSTPLELTLNAQRLPLAGIIADSYNLSAECF
ncbi:MAG: hypothetical protein ACI9WS_003247 [Paraglaciecola psychrophila]|jgi:hypothetical protein